MKKLRRPYHKSESRSFSPGQNIFREGDTGDTMYVVLEGSIDLLVHDRIVEKLGPGGVLGEMALVEPAPRSATAIARTECKVVPVNQQRFSLLVQHTPDFALQIMRVMADRLRTMDARL
ncbi:MAG TPA: cyclic nucleotide-binding domain-containing protein [Burkholderiales bacterium]|nr:cyclic nucleotide-binding domain-containing protein [Burkholderiales bacterium]